MRRPQLHVLTDPGLSRGRSHAEIATLAIEGGADVIQLRDKTLEREELLRTARELLPIVRAGGARLVINDDLEVALASGADGLHLESEDLPLDEARKRWSGWLGGSARTPERARQLVKLGADYLGVGPLWGSGTKPEAGKAVGVERIAEIVAAVAVPIIAIGGIGPGGAAPAIQAGAAGVAVLSSVVAALDPRAAVSELRRELDEVNTGC